jgi:hypothetical protein
MIVIQDVDAIVLSRVIANIWDLIEIKQIK